jgi:hypothetical protein
VVKIKFCISTIEYFQQHGFDITDLRKSIDGTKIIVHLEYAQILIPNIENDSNVTIYQCPSDDLTNLLNSSAWTNSQF